MHWLLDWPEIPTVLLAISGIGILLFSDQRILLGIIAFEYLLSFWLMLTHLPFVESIALLLAGILAVLILAISTRAFSRQPSPAGGALPGSVAFRLAAGSIGILAAVGALRAEVVQLSELSAVYSLGGLILILTGFLQLALTSNQLRIGLGLLTLLAGFSMLYVAIEPSLAVVALLALVHLGIALTISYTWLQSHAGLFNQRRGAMNAPFLLLTLSFFISLIAFGLRDQPRWSSTWVSLSMGVVAGLVLLVGFDEPYGLLGLSIKLPSQWGILGRSLGIGGEIRPMIGYLYLATAFMVAPTWIVAAPRYFTSIVPLMLAAVAASLMVQPFLFAAIFIGLAAMSAVLLLVSPGTQDTDGAMRLLILYTLAMIIVLVTGWQLETSGVTSASRVARHPGDRAAGLWFRHSAGDTTFSYLAATRGPGGQRLCRLLRRANPSRCRLILSLPVS